MPFYFRKAIKAGPFRFNLSKSGLGLSVGIKGLRVGRGPRGHYIHAGRSGLYYRGSLGGAGEGGRRSRSQSIAPTELHGQQNDEPQRSDTNDEMVEIESGDVMDMRDEQFQEILDEINSKQARIRYETLFGWGMVLLGLAASLRFGWRGTLLLALAIPAWMFGKWLDSRTRTSVLYYQLDDEVKKAYEAMTRAFDDMMSCSGKWHIESVSDAPDATTRKRNAGATQIVTRTATTLVYAAPRDVVTNITPPSIKLGRQTVYFFPDGVYIVEGTRVGAIEYNNLGFRWEELEFIEEEPVPADAKLIRHTWRYPNDEGGPDRRFNDNYQIPVCLYEEAHITSEGGLDELIQFSRTGVVETFSSALNELTLRTGQAKKRLGQTV